MWARLRKKIDVEDPAPLTGQVYLVYTQWPATNDEESIKAKTDLFQRITTSNVHETLTRKAAHNTHTVSARRYDVLGCAEQCVEVEDTVTGSNINVTI